MSKIWFYLLPMAALVLIQQLAPGFLPGSRKWRQPVDIYFVQKKTEVSLPEKPIGIIWGNRKFAAAMAVLWIAMGVFFFIWDRNTPFYYYLPIPIAVFQNFTNAYRRLVLYPNAIGIQMLTRKRLFFISDLYSLSSRMISKVGPVYVLYITAKQPAAVLRPQDYEDLFSIEDFYTTENPLVREVKKDETWEAKKKGANG